MKACARYHATTNVQTGNVRTGHVAPSSPRQAHRLRQASNRTRDVTADQMREKAGGFVHDHLRRCQCTLTRSASTNEGGVGNVGVGKNEGWRSSELKTTAPRCHDQSAWEKLDGQICSIIQQSMSDSILVVRSSPHGYCRKVTDMPAACKSRKSWQICDSR